MPSIQDHSARLRDPEDFDDSTFREVKDGTIYGSVKIPASVSVIWAKLKGKSGSNDPVLPQALRFPKDTWTAAEAKAWLKENNVRYIEFEEAREATGRETVIDAELCGWGIGQSVLRELTKLEGKKGVDETMQIEKEELRALVKTMQLKPTDLWPLSEIVGELEKIKREEDGRGCKDTGSSPIPYSTPESNEFIP